jgi:hypothetical protein
MGKLHVPITKKTQRNFRVGQNLDGLVARVVSNGRPDPLKWQGWTFKPLKKVAFIVDEQTGQPFGLIT